MTRDGLYEIIQEDYEAILDLFWGKNLAYGDKGGENAFYNFEQTAARVWGNMDMEHQFKVLLTYMDKHLVALANKGLDDHEVQERLRDVAVYSLIGIAMAKEHDSTKPEYPSVEIKYAEGVNNKNAQGNSFIPRPTDYC